MAGTPPTTGPSGLTSSLSSAMNPSGETTAPMIAFPMCISFLGRCLRPLGRGDALGVASRPLDQLDPVAVWVDNERRPEAVLALLAGRDGLDPSGSLSIVRCPIAVFGTLPTTS